MWKAFPEKDHMCKGAVCCFKYRLLLIYFWALMISFSNVQAASFIGTNATPFHQRCRLLNRAQKKDRWSLSFFLVWRMWPPCFPKKNFKFQLIWPQNSFHNRAFTSTCGLHNEQSLCIHLHDWPRVFGTLCWGTLCWNYSTISMHFFEICEHLPIFTSEELSFSKMLFLYTVI